MSKFKDGDVVLLHADPGDFDPDECPADEVGTVLEDEGNGMYLVEVFEEYRLDGWDDGIREVEEDQMSYYRPIGKGRT